MFLSREVIAVFGALAAIILALAGAALADPDRCGSRSTCRCWTSSPWAIRPPTSPRARRVLQLIAGFVGLAVLPIVVAATMNATDAFRTASVGHPSAEDLTDHIVLVGLGKIGTRVLAQLCTSEHRVVVVERDPHARGVALARELGVPLLLEDAGAPGVLDRARIRQSRSLLVLTRDDGENLDIVMAAREANPHVRVVMRLYDDDFAATVSGTLRASYPGATTRRRSVSARGSTGAPHTAGSCAPGAASWWHRPGGAWTS
ncbi:NAD-binding protein [Streptomyces sp. C10]|uniref:NAD-binding protein n=1 Tax=Streptomyces sp. C10 TaxID=531941 RepID=UPI00398010AE